MTFSEISVAVLQLCQEMQQDGIKATFYSSIIDGRLFVHVLVLDDEEKTALVKTISAGQKDYSEDFLRLKERIERTIK
jgi:hypothetical protein